MTNSQCVTSDGDWMLVNKADSDFLNNGQFCSDIIDLLRSADWIFSGGSESEYREETCLGGT